MDKIICSKCKHWELISSEDTKKYEDNIESYHCPLCWQPVKSKVRRQNNYVVCGSCAQVWDGIKIQPCKCPQPAYKMTIGMPQLPKSKATPNLKDHMGKTRQLVHQRFRDLDNEDKKRQIKMAENLQLIADSLTKKVEVEPIKKYSGQAIQ